MVPAASISKLGFRRWHERQLVEGHAWFVTGLLSVVALAALLEVLNFHAPMLERLLMLAAAFGAGLLACYAFNTYFRILGRAQHLAQHSTCKRCGSYGRYALVAASADSMNVRCSKCGHEWRIG